MLSFVLKDQVKKVPPLDGGIELCGSSSCLGGWRLHLACWLCKLYLQCSNHIC